jgi:hypothetical protein
MAYYMLCPRQKKTSYTLRIRGKLLFLCPYMNIFNQHWWRTNQHWWRRTSTGGALTSTGGALTSTGGAVCKGATPLVEQ